MNNLEALEFKVWYQLKVLKALNAKYSYLRMIRIPKLLEVLRYIKVIQNMNFTL